MFFSHTFKIIQFQQNISDPSRSNWLVRKKGKDQQNYLFFSMFSKYVIIHNIGFLKKQCCFIHGGILELMQRRRKRRLPGGLSSGHPNPSPYSSYHHNSLLSQQRKRKDAKMRHLFLFVTPTPPPIHLPSSNHH